MSRWHNIYLESHSHFCTYTVRNWQSRLTGAVVPDHVHMLIWSESGDSIVRFLQRVLGQTSKRLKPGGGFWKERPRVFPVYSGDVIRRKMEYMHGTDNCGRSWQRGRRIGRIPATGRS